MSWVALPTSVRSTEHGEVRFVGPEVLRELLTEAEQDGFLTASFTPPGPGQRGRLGLVIEDAIETALQGRGACPPGIGASSDLDASLSDQLYRARLIEYRGIALAVPTLEGVASLGGALDAEDSAVLRWWMKTSAERPVRLYFSAADRVLGVYGPPVPFQQLLTTLARSEHAAPLDPPPSEAPPELAPEVAASSAAMELSELPPAVHVEAATPEIADSAENEALPTESTFESDSVSAEEAVAATNSDVDELVDESLLHAMLESQPELQAAPAQAAEMPVEADPPIVEQHAARIERVPHGPLYPNAAEDWRAWIHELESVRGPKPLAVVERMFVTSYVPLSDALARGLAGPEAERALSSWGSSFEQSYREAFDALRVRGKRPTMVLDVPDLALRIGRLHGARSVQLVVVDGMRFDLGLRIEHRLRKGLGQAVALTERLLLWSALPSTTAVQLELIGRGPEALKAFTGEVNSEVPVARGRNAATLRRIRAGHRELLKLDLVESRLSEPGGPEAERLDELADETASTLIAYFERLPARTLVMVFGDHGFLLDPLDGGTTSANQGGASPEEVLVPAFAWLVGGVH